MPPVAIALPEVARTDTPWRRAWADYSRSKVAVAALAIVIVICLLAALAPWISPQNPYDLSQLNILDSRLPPGSVGDSGITYWLGTDDQGRDMLSAILYGIRTSMLVGVSSGVIALMIGTIAGVVIGYFGGFLDVLVMRLADFQLGVPPILVALVLIATLGQGVDKIIIALVVVQWAYYARTVRATVQVERRKEYVDAARCLELSPFRIMFRHILPNCFSPLIVIGMIQVAYSIGLEATLSFLGLGLPVTEPSLGLLIANGYGFVMSGLYWISFFPGLMLATIIVSLNLVGDQSRDVLNPRLQR